MIDALIRGDIDGLEAIGMVALIADEAKRKSKGISMSKLRIVYIPQVPGKPFIKEVQSRSEGKLIAETLVAFSNFEYENNIKPDYSDMLDLEEFVDGEWISWEDEFGSDFSEWMDKE